MPGNQGRPVSAVAGLSYDATGQGDTAFTITCTLDDTWYTIADAEIQAEVEDPSNIFTVSASAGTITALRKVTGMVFLNAVLSGDEASTVGELGVMIDSTAAATQTRTLGVATLAASMAYSIAVPITLEAGEVLSAAVQTDDDADVFTVHSFSLAFLETHQHTA